MCMDNSASDEAAGDPLAFRLILDASRLLMKNVGSPTLTDTPGWSQPSAWRSLKTILTYIPAWNPPPKSTGSPSCSRCAKVIKIRSREDTSSAPTDLRSRSKTFMPVFIGNCGALQHRLTTDSIHEFPLNLLKRFPIRLWHGEQNKEKSCGDNTPIEPEGPGGAEAGVKQRKRIGEDETGDP